MIIGDECDHTQNTDLRECRLDEHALQTCLAIPDADSEFKEEMTRTLATMIASDLGDHRGFSRIYVLLYGLRGKECPFPVFEKALQITLARMKKNWVGSSTAYFSRVLQNLLEERQKAQNSEPEPLTYQGTE